MREKTGKNPHFLLRAALWIWRLCGKLMDGTADSRLAIDSKDARLPASGSPAPIRLPASGQNADFGSSAPLGRTQSDSGGRGCRGDACQTGSTRDNRLFPGPWILSARPASSGGNSPAPKSRRPGKRPVEPAAPPDRGRLPAVARTARQPKRKHVERHT